MPKNQFYKDYDKERYDSPASSPDPSEYRDPFQIDRDRIIHSNYFRSLQSKTQVFWSGEYDFYRTRLTHSLEVAQIGRAITQWLKTNSKHLNDEFYISSDLVEASCLAHDLGHPPFGHSGETALNRLLEPYGGFEGNAQTLRLITQRLFGGRKGMSPSRAFIDSILKYKTTWQQWLDANKKTPKNHFLYNEQAQILEWVFRGFDLQTEVSDCRERNQFRSIECQIMDWSDDTAYSLNDLEDSIRAGFLTIPSLLHWAKANELSTKKGTAVGDLLLAIQSGKVEGMLGKRIGNHIKATSLSPKNPASTPLSSETNRYAYDLTIDPDIQADCKIFKRLAYEVVFQSASLKQLEHKGHYLLTRLWETLSPIITDPNHEPIKLLPPKTAQIMNKAHSENERARILCDYIADLTDTSANKLYKRLYTPDFGSISELI